MNAPAMFTENTTRITVPHTEYLQQCENCLGRGRIQCHDCQGRGFSRCPFCTDGFKTRDGERVACNTCNGTGRRRCSDCNGDGLVECKKCNGRGRVVMFIEVGVGVLAESQLTVSFINHLETIVLEARDIPERELQGAKGTVISQ